MIKGIGDLFSLVIIILITFIGIALVISASQPTVDAALTSSDIKNAENVMKIINDNIKEVQSEGAKSRRIIAFTAPMKFETIPEEDAVQFSTVASTFEYLTRIFRYNVVYITGDDVRCAEEDGNNDGSVDLVVENQYIKGVFLSVKKSTPYRNYDTSNMLIAITEKTNSNTINFANSSVVIDDNLSTTAGNGYSEISKLGSSSPLCQVHFFMNSTVDYDVYYKLYAGSDFFVVDVRNII